MKLSGEYRIAAPREDVWRALNDPDVLRSCIPGCEALEATGDGEYSARIVAAIGPVRASFDTLLRLEEPRPPRAYRLVGESKGGAAGFARGAADVQLDEAGDATVLRYDADFKVGGRLAQVGSRLVEGATKKTADAFFDSFSRSLDAGTVQTAAQPPAGDSNVFRRTWIGIAAALVVLLLWWFLLR